MGLSPKQLGRFRAIYLTALVSIGSFCYDTGIVGTVLTMPSFKNDFRYTTSEQTDVNSNAVSILQGGAFFGCLFISPVSARIGRRIPLVLASLIFIVGSALQTINSHSIDLFYVGRVIAGLGVGAATVILPIYTAECAPREIRGTLGGCFQFFFTLGVAAAYWTTYACKEVYAETDNKQWRIPGGLLGLGMALIPESPRWLATKDKKEKALQNLVWLRGGVLDNEIQEEFDEIVNGIERERLERSGFSWREVLVPKNRSYSHNPSPYIGQQGIAKIVGCLTYILFFVDRYGRRSGFISGAAAMSALFLIISLVPPLPAGTIAPSAIASILMVYFEAIAFNMSWGPLCWLYLGEIFPNRIREIGVTTGACSQWLFNFVFSQVTPHAFNNIGAWKTFLMFAIFNFAVIGYAYIFLRETKGISLETMEQIFGSNATTLEAVPPPPFEEEPGSPKSVSKSSLEEQIATAKA
ncbi:general substrate transporter [Atractiella rhizophila]|nr:general substrate transporter [Atractiella rhizophila]